MAVWIHVAFLLIMTPCNLVDGYQRFGRTCHLHFQNILVLRWRPTS